MSDRDDDCSLPPARITGGGRNKTPTTRSGRRRTRPARPGHIYAWCHSGGSTSVFYYYICYNCATSLVHVGGSQTNAPVQLRNRCYEGANNNDGPWVWLAYRAGRCHIPYPICASCSLTFVQRVHSHTFEFEGGIGAPRFFASGRVVCIRIDHVMPARGAGARYR